MCIRDSTNRAIILVIKTTIDFTLSLWFDWSGRVFHLMSWWVSFVYVPVIDPPGCKQPAFSPGGRRANNASITWGGGRGVQRAQTICVWLDGYLVSWCFKPSQPQRITSGLNTNFTTTPRWILFHKSSSFHKSCFFEPVYMPRALNTGTCIQQDDLVYSAGQHRAIGHHVQSSFEHC